MYPKKSTSPKKKKEKKVTILHNGMDSILNTVDKES